MEEQNLERFSNLLKFYELMEYQDTSMIATLTHESIRKLYDRDDLKAIFDDFNLDQLANLQISLSIYQFDKFFKRLSNQLNGPKKIHHKLS